MEELSPSLTLKEERSKELGEAVVSVSRPLITLTADGLLTQVEGSVLSDLGTADDVLQNISGVLKDGERWEVIGRGAPLIYLNGRKLRSLSELYGIRSEDVKSVEVITNPGARYAASVRSVIRIRTNKPRGEGFSTDAMSYYLWDKQNYLWERLEVNYRRGGTNIFSTYTYSDMHNWQGNREEQVTRADTLWDMVTTGTTKSRTSSHYALIGISHDMKNNQSIGLWYSANIPSLGNSMSMGTNVVHANSTPYDSLSTTRGSEDESKPLHRLNAYYAGKIHKTDVDLSADFYHSDNKSYILTNEGSTVSSPLKLQETDFSKSLMVAARLALSSPLLGGQLGYGSEASYTRRKEHSEYDHTEIIANSGNKILESSAAAFLEYSHKVGTSFLRAGARYEYVRMRYFRNENLIEEQSRTFNNVFPHISYNLQIGKTYWQLAYNIKIRHPSYGRLSSNVTYSNRFSRSVGNPNLRNEFWHTLSLTGSWKFLQGQVYYMDQRNAILSHLLQLPDDESVTVCTFMNEKSVKAASFYINMSPKIGIWLPQLHLECIKTWYEQPYQVDQDWHTRPTFIVRLNNTLKLPLDFIATANFSYRSAGLMQNTWLYGNTYILNLSLRKTFLHKSLSIQVNGNDLLARSPNNVVLFNNVTKLKTETYHNGRSISFTLHYNFNTDRSRYRGKTAGSDVMQRL